MPEKQLDEFPTQDIREQLLEGSEQIFVAAYNSARENGMSQDAATQVAWTSVKQGYEQQGDGKWHRKPQDSNTHHKPITSGGN